MNEIKKEDIIGIFNFIGSCQNFNQEFYTVKKFKIYSNEMPIGDPLYGFICWFKEDRDIVLKINTSLKSFLNIKNYINTHTKSVQTSQDLISTMSNFSKTNLIGAIVPFLDGEHYISYLLMEKDGEYLAVNTYVSDIVCLCQKTKVPVYINKEIIKAKGIPSDEVVHLLEDWEKEDDV
jgi:bifunctional DNase/RNase